MLLWGSIVRAFLSDGSRESIPSDGNHRNYHSPFNADHPLSRTNWRALGKILKNSARNLEGGPTHKGKGRDARFPPRGTSNNATDLEDAPRLARRHAAALRG